MSELYHFQDIRVAEPPEPTEESRLRREVAGELNRLNEQLIRLDAPMNELEAVRARLAELNEQLESRDKRDYPQMLQRLLTGRGSRQDVLDVLDFEILTGRATAVHTPLELWLDGDRVRGRGWYGLTWQGPPAVFTAA